MTWQQQRSPSEVLLGAVGFARTEVCVIPSDRTAASLPVTLNLG